MSYKILLVDDEPDILEFVGYNLKKRGYEVHTATNGKDAIEIALKILPHLILLDVMMPEMDGVETCRKIRKYPQMSNTVIAFLTARGEDYSQIAGFEAGADDYISKPIKMRVLVSRVKALLKRTKMGPVESGYADIDPRHRLIMDQDKHIVIKDNEEIVLPRKEFNLLWLLYNTPQKVFTRDEIFSEVWGDDVIVGDRTIDVHIRKLREKIGEEHIVTVKGVGYKYEF